MPLEGIRLARLAADAGADRRRLQGGRRDEGQAAAAGGERGGVRRVEGGTSGPAADHAADSAVHAVEGFASNDERPLKELLNSARRRRDERSTRSSTTSRRSSPGSTATSRSRGAWWTTTRAKRPGRDRRPKATGPPFLMLGLNLENITQREFRVSLAARYLAYDVVGSGSELRIDGTAGFESVHRGRAVSPNRLDPALRGALRRRAHRLARRHSRTMQVVARYGQTMSRGRDECRRESRTSERSARRRLHRPPDANVANRQSRPAVTERRENAVNSSSGATTRRTGR